MTSYTNSVLMWKPPRLEEYVLNITPVYDFVIIITTLAIYKAVPDPEVQFVVHQIYNLL